MKRLLFPILIILIFIPALTYAFDDNQSEDTLKGSGSFRVEARGRIRININAQSNVSTNQNTTTTTINNTVQIRPCPCNEDSTVTVSTNVNLAPCSQPNNVQLQETPCPCEEEQISPCDNQVTVSTNVSLVPTNRPTITENITVRPCPCDQQSTTTTIAPIIRPCPCDQVTTTTVAPTVQPCPCNQVTTTTVPTVQPCPCEQITTTTIPDVNLIPTERPNNVNTSPSPCSQQNDNPCPCEQNNSPCNQPCPQNNPCNQNNTTPCPCEQQNDDFDNDNDAEEDDNERTLSLYAFNTTYFPLYDTPLPLLGLGGEYFISDTIGFALNLGFFSQNEDFDFYNRFDSVFTSEILMNFHIPIWNSFEITFGFGFGIFSFEYSDSYAYTDKDGCFVYYSEHITDSFPYLVTSLGANYILSDRIKLGLGFNYFKPSGDRDINDLFGDYATSQLGLSNFSVSINTGILF